MTTAPRAPARHGRPLAGATALAVAVAAIGACGDTPPILPSRNFDRPTDLAFACLRIVGEARDRVAGRPMNECHPPWVQDEKGGVLERDGNDLFTFAFVPNSERGDLAAIDMTTCRPDDGACFPPGARLVDLDRSAIGFGAAPLGALPEVLVASQDGCRLVTANHGSCDFTFINPAVLMTPYLVGESASLPPSTFAETVVPRTASGRLAVTPGEIAFLPQLTSTLTGVNNLCDPGGRPGTLAAPVGAPPATPGAPATWRAVATFPSCDLVALLDLPSGEILDSVKVRPDPMAPDALVFERTGRDPVCPVADCGGAAASTPPPDEQELRVGPLAVRPEGKRVYVGAANAPAVGALDIVGDTLVEAAEGKSTRLHEGAGGVLRMRLSVDPYAYARGQTAAGDPARPQLGRFVAGPHRDQMLPLEFLYVIARDGSVRVVDVGRAVPKECELRIDPMDEASGARDGDDAVRIPCFPVEVGVDDGPRPRLRFAPGGLGLRFPSAPQDITFADYFTDADPDPNRAERVLTGAFAFVLTIGGPGGGQIFIVNVDPALRLLRQYRDGTPGYFPEYPEPLTHSLRNVNVITWASGLVAEAGPPRVDNPPTTPAQGPVMSLQNCQPSESNPSPRCFRTQDTRANAKNVPTVALAEAGTFPSPNDRPPAMDTWVFFTNPLAAIPQAWSIAWEADLTGPRVGADLLELGDAIPPLASALADSGISFCGAGALLGDVATVLGCEEDANCGPGRTCVRSPRVPEQVGAFPILGLCLRRSDPIEQYRDGICRDLLETFRRYEITAFKKRNRFPGDMDGPLVTLILEPKKDELPRVAWKNAAGEMAACETPADCAVAPNERQRFTCVPVPEARPGEPVRRCFQRCGAGIEEPCRGGNICTTFPNGQFCAQGAPLREECGMDELVPYKLSVGSAFLVLGSATGRTEAIHQVEDKITHEKWCAFDDTTLEDLPELVARIPMNAVDCDIALPPTPTPMTETEVVGTMGKVWEGVSQAFLSETRPPVGRNPCFVREEYMVLVSGQPEATRERYVSAVFQNTELRFVLQRLEEPFTNAPQIRFEVHGGFAGQQVVTNDIGLTLPVRMVTGPVPSFRQSSPGQPNPLGIDGLPGPDMPYLYVIDQRVFLSTGRLGARGQLLRIHPRVSDVVPGIETPSSSNSYFPIQ